MRCLCPLLSKWRHEDGRKGEKSHPTENLQRLNNPFDERKRKDVIKGVMKYWKDGRMDLDDLENLP